jgi:hypothetical protein
MASTDSKNTTITKVDQRQMNADPAQGISICIPRVFNNIGWRRIKQVFIDLRWGFIDRVDVIPCGGKFKRAFVHFAPGKWNMRDKKARESLTALQKGNEVKVIYDEPWFWKISISASKKPDEAPKPRARPNVTFGRKKVIELDAPYISARSEERKKARKLRIAKKPKKKINIRNDPIVARAMENSPKTCKQMLDNDIEDGEVTNEDLERMSMKKRHMDEAEAGM